jgi:hypothetical protein
MPGVEKTPKEGGPLTNTTIHQQADRVKKKQGAEHKNLLVPGCHHQSKVE